MKAATKATNNGKDYWSDVVTRAYKVTTVDITEESDWTKYAVGKTVYIKGKFDDVEVPEGTTDFDQYLDKMTFQNGAVKFI